MTATRSMVDVAYDIMSKKKRSIAMRQETLLLPNGFAIMG